MLGDILKRVIESRTNCKQALEKLKCEEKYLNEFYSLFPNFQSEPQKSLGSSPPPPLFPLENLAKINQLIDAKEHKEKMITKKIPPLKFSNQEFSSLKTSKPIEGLQPSPNGSSVKLPENLMKEFEDFENLRLGYKTHYDKISFDSKVWRGYESVEKDVQKQINSNPQALEKITSLQVSFDGIDIRNELDEELKERQEETQGRNAGKAVGDLKFQENITGTSISKEGAQLQPLLAIGRKGKMCSSEQPFNDSFGDTRVAEKNNPKLDAFDAPDPKKTTPPEACLELQNKFKDWSEVHITSITEAIQELFKQKGKNTKKKTPKNLKPRDLYKIYLNKLAEKSVLNMEPFSEEDVMNKIRLDLKKLTCR